MAAVSETEYGRIIIKTPAELKRETYNKMRRNSFKAALTTVATLVHPIFALPALWFWGKTYGDMRKLDKIGTIPR